MPRELLMTNSFAWTDAEGRLITVDKALRCNARNLLVEGKTYQNLSISSSGKTIMKSGAYVDLFNSTNGANMIKLNTTYTLIMDIKDAYYTSANFGLITSIEYSDGTSTLYLALTKQTDGRYVRTFTFKNPVKSMNLGVHNSNTSDCYCDMSSIMLLEGDYTNSYIPSNVDGIESVAERESKNLLENVTWHDGFVEGNGTITTNSSYPNAKYSSLIPVNIKTLYYSNLVQNSSNIQNQIRLRGYTENGDGITDLIFPSSFNAMFNARNEDGWRDAKYIRILILNSSVYRLPTTPILIPNSYTETDMYPLQITQSHYETDGIVLPNGVKNSIENGVHIQRVGKAILNGSENITLDKNSTNTIIYGIQAENCIVQSANITTQYPLCDKYTGIAQGSLWSNDIEGCSYSSHSGGRIRISILKSKLSNETVSAFINYISQNHITVYYELATPVYTPITEPSAITEINLPVPLRNLPNGTKDTIEDGKLIQRVNKTIMDGSDDENWVLNNGYLETGTRLNPNAKSNSSMISNYPVVNISYTQENKPYGTFITGAGKLRVVTVTTGNETDLSQAKARLQQNPLEVYYELATPIEHTISVPPITISKGGNIVTTSNNIQPNLKLTYKKSTRKKPTPKPPKPPTTTYLYNAGNENTSLTGGYLTSSNNSATCNIEKQADNLYVNCTGKTSFDSICYARTNKTIKPCKIKVSVKNNYISANGIAFCVFLSEKEAITSVSDFNSVVNKKYIKASNTTQGQYIDLEMDLTDSTEGYFYIACMVAGNTSYTCTANIRKIEITKVNKFLNNYYGYLLIAGLCNTTGIALTRNTANVFVSDVIDTIGNTLEPFVSYREYNNNYYLSLEDIVISKFIDFANSNKSKYDINLNFTSLNEYKAHYGSGRPTDIVVPGSEQDIDWKTNSNIYIPNGQPASNYKCNIIKKLYDNGDEIVNDTGGWTAGNNSTMDSGSVTKYSDKIYFNCLTNGIENKVMFLACNNMIDTSKYSCLKVKAQVTEMANSAYKPSLGFGLVTEKFDIGKWNILYEIMGTDSEPTVYELPISSKNAGYIEISGYIASGYFYEVWLLM